MPSNRSKLSPEQRAVWDAAKAITDAAVAANRELTAGEHRQLDAHFKQLDALEAAVRNDVAALITPREPRIPNMNQTMTFLRSGGRGSTTVPYAAPETRALDTVTSSAGGATVPDDFVRELWRHLEARSPILSAARVFATPAGRDLDVPILASTGTAVTATQGSAIGGTDPTFSTLQLKSFKFAQLLKVSGELLRDNGVQLESYFAEIFASNVDALVGPKYAFGTGTAEPSGYASGAGSAIIGGTGVAGAFSYDDLANMLGGLESNHQAGAFFMMSPSAVSTLRKLKDNEARPLWQPAMAAGEPATLFGRPVVTDPHLGSVAVGGTSVVCVDPQAFAVRVADGGLQVDRSADAFFSSDEVAFRAILRTDSGYLSDAAAVRFVGGTA